MSVIVIGSSGGGAATLGHTDPTELLTTINDELSKIRIPATTNTSSSSSSAQQRRRPPHIKYALFVSLQSGEGLDMADPQTSIATLYTVGIPPHTNHDSSSSSSSSIFNTNTTTSSSIFNTNTTTSSSNNNTTTNETINKTTTTTTTTKTPSSSFHVLAQHTAPLHEINNLYRHLERTLLSPTLPSISAIILISCNPLLTHHTLTHASRLSIPCTGSGGTSLSQAVSTYGIRLVGNAGGSVATTTYTRALSYSVALAEEWGGAYRPLESGLLLRRRPTVVSVWEACLPCFVMACLAKRWLLSLSLDRHSSERTDGLLTILEWYTLPVVTSIIMSSSYAPERASPTALMAAVLPGLVCRGSALGGLLGGWMVSWMMGRVLVSCVRWGIPATMTTILVGGGIGLVVALGMEGMGVVGVLRGVTEWVRVVLGSVMPVRGLGFMFGCLFCYGSKVGWYHAVFLPVILLEMERGDASVWGAVDECTLVLVSAGICTANIMCHPPRDDNNNSNNDGGDNNAMSSSSSSSSSSLSRRGLLINLSCGDFIEAAYPSMERSAIINAFAYLASGLSTEILYSSSHHFMKGGTTATATSAAVASSAYLPVVVSVWLADDRWRMGGACIVAFGISFVGGILGNVVGRRRQQRRGGMLSSGDDKTL